MEVYRTPDAQFVDLPGFAVEPRYLMQDELRMHYVDEGRGEPVLLLHGEPTWSFLYRKVIGELQGSCRCVAPDYFGFGRSDKPVDREWYSYDRTTSRSPRSSSNSTCKALPWSSRTGAARSALGFAWSNVSASPASSS